MLIFCSKIVAVKMLQGMDISEYTRIVFDKLQKLEPEHATKIIGYLLVQEHGEEQMIKLASYPDHLIREVAFKAKTEFQRLTTLPDLRHLITLQLSSPSWDHHSFSELQKQFEIFETRMANDYYIADSLPCKLRGGRRFSNEFPVKTCHYFNKGYCKHGASCRYYHGQAGHEMYGSYDYSSSSSVQGDQVISAGSLANLESEIVELLKSRKGSPISIASLPMAYYEKYNKVLQAEGYLTESQRHGKSGYSLTKLLARWKNCIRVFDRPHGQHAVVLAEDAPKYIGKGEFGQNISASRQIYLTFPADSTFTEEDVSNYFNTFGSVEDVRIPCQQRRMFGFVTFVEPETVKMILEKGNPHYVRGSRVLVKPYKEKPKVDRKYVERIEHPDCYSSRYVGLDAELTSEYDIFSLDLLIVPRRCGNPQGLRRFLIEEQEHALEFQRRRVAELQLGRKWMSNSPHFGFDMEELKVPDDHFNHQSTGSSSSYASTDKSGYTKTEPNYTDQDSCEGLNLPESPFAFPVDNEISAMV
ncbi:hypothetical protein Ahy_A01g004620 [Arachis hypogaea]|uniref:Zinc finger CCCH domain-containing protein n=1 Tax=Arachis hypogaea TaxID=3818 RepID=A0A445EWL5_ARAHY|nr:hypothetical protein Ahy_A01g004620 [Arachis hypogaea]